MRGFARAGSIGLITILAGMIVPAPAQAAGVPDPPGIVHVVSYQEAVRVAWPPG